MKQYEIEYWEQESVWVRRRVFVETDQEIRQDNFVEIMCKPETNVEYKQSDYNWETSESIEIDDETDVEIQEIGE